jgi:hypothetical protein
MDGLLIQHQRSGRTTRRGKWFVPLDIMLGRKSGKRWVTSIEYRYGVVRGVDSYKNWIEARIGYFFLGKIPLLRSD